MATAETSMTRPHKSVGRQVIRAAVGTVVGLGVLWLVALLLTTPDEKAPALIENDLDRHTAFHLAPQWTALLIVVVLAGISWVLWRRIRRWSARPRWLLPTLGGLAAIACIVALAPFTVPKVDPLIDGSTDCVALVNAWSPGVPTPSPSDLNAYKTANEPLTRAQYQDPAVVAAARLAQTAPAYQRVERYWMWTYGNPSSACVPRSRKMLGGAAAVLAAGLVCIGGVLVLKRVRTISA
jgi:hypothetical protein